MDCRKCGACCFAPSISSPIPGMPDGKPAMTKCIHLTSEMLCAIWGSPERPLVCHQSKADAIFCGENYQDAVKIFSNLE